MSLTKAEQVGRPQTGVNKPYAKWISKLPCAVCLAERGLSKGLRFKESNESISQGHHEPPKGLGGGPENDIDRVPLCVNHHIERHAELGNVKEICASVKHLYQEEWDRKNK